MVNLTRNRLGTNNTYFTWGPDGQRIVFDSNHEGNYDIYVIGVDGRGLVNLTQSPSRESSPIWLFPLEYIE